MRFCTTSFSQGVQYRYISQPALVCGAWEADAERRPTEMRATFKQAALTISERTRVRRNKV